MKIRKTISLYFLLSLVGFGIGYVLTNSVQFGICTYSGLVRDPVCLNFYERLGDPIFYGMGALAIVFFILLIVPMGFPAWKKFAIWFIPFATLLFIFYPDPGSGDLFSPFPETVFKWVSGVYVVLSALVISWGTLLAKKA